MPMPVAVISSAPESWKLLNGVLCLYKKSPLSCTTMVKTLKNKLCEDLNSMKTRPQQTIVELRKLEAGQESPKEHGRTVVTAIQNGSQRIEIIKGPSYADHPAVIGPRYQQQDIKYNLTNMLGFRVSGIALVGINKGIFASRKIYYSQWMRVYQISGRFGTATDTMFDDGKIEEKATFHKINRPMLERLLDVSQASHQRLMFQAAGVPMDSQRAYDLASQGMLRPIVNTAPVVYSLKLLDFKLPDFQIEVRVVNETEAYLATLIHELGLKLNTAASCTKLRCIKYGPFELQHALLSKHWGIENCIKNIISNDKILKDFNFTIRDPLISTKVDENDLADEEEETGEIYDDRDSNNYTNFSR